MYRQQIKAYFGTFNINLVIKDIEKMQVYYRIIILITYS